MLLAVMQLSDSALPTGAFSHSLGFETYMDRETIRGEADFGSWLEMFIAQSLTTADALAIRLVYQADTFDEVADLDELMTVQALPQQIRDSGITMGRRLLAIGAESYPGPWVEDYRVGIDEGRLSGHQATIWAVLARQLAVPVHAAVASHLYATVISLTQNAVRAIPLGQSAGQRVIRQAQPWVERAVARSGELDLDDLGAIAPGLEIAQMQHQRQRARLFMS